jgi:antitoxin YefM
MVMPDVLPLSSVKAHLSEVVDRVELEQERVVLTRNGKAAAVLISTDDLEGLEETLAILSDPTLREQIREGEAAAAAGDTATLEELQADLLARRASHRAT